eukprot:11490264-Heterocapsa_arctica.AAC.1
MCTFFVRIGEGSPVSAKTRARLGVVGAEEVVVAIVSADVIVLAEDIVDQGEGEDIIIQVVGYG